MPFMFFHNPEGYEDWLRKINETFLNSFKDMSQKPSDPMIYTGRDAALPSPNEIRYTHSNWRYSNLELDTETLAKLNKQCEESLERLIRELMVDGDDLGVFRDFLATLPDDEFNNP